MSIGQGYLEVTPLQLVKLISLIANKGRIMKPMLVKRIMDNKGNIIKNFSPVTLSKINLCDETWDIIQHGLEEAVISGTAQIVRFRSLKVAGKTGTAQNPHGEDHAWFVCYAPTDRPKVSMVVFVEHGGHGASASVPIARRILKSIFFLKKEVPPKVFIAKD